MNADYADGEHQNAAPKRGSLRSPPRADGADTQILEGDTPPRSEDARMLSCIRALNPLKPDVTGAF